MVSSESKINFIAIVFLFALVFAVYVNSFQNQFVLDDLELVVNNPLIKSWQNAVNIFKVGLFPGLPLMENFYRPIQSLSLMWDYSFWQQNPLGYHLTNAFIHCLNAILIFFIIMLSIQSRRVAIVASALFAVHPIHTAAVTYISGRADPLAAFFTLASLLFFIIYTKCKRAITYVVSITSFVLALLSKEISLILPLLIILYDKCFLRKEEKQSFIKVYIKRYGIFFCIAVSYIILRMAILNFNLADVSPIARLNFYTRFLTTCHIFVSYTRLLFLPFGLHIDRAAEPISQINLPSIGEMAILAILVYAFVKSYKVSKIAFFASVWFLISFLPVSNLFFPLNALMAEHWMYFPSIGFFILASLGFNRLNRLNSYRWPVLIFGIALVVFYSFLTMGQNIIWKDRQTLYNYTLKFSPDRPRMHSYLGNAYLDKGQFENALVEFKEAIRLNPEYAQNYSNLGNLYYKMERYEDAVEAYKKAIELKPNLASAYNNLGNAFVKKEEYAKAIEAYNKAAELSPYDYEIWINLAKLYHKRQDFDNSIRAYKKALSLNAKLFETYYNLGIIYAQMNNFTMAKECWEKTIKINPDFQKAKANLEILNNTRVRIK